MYNLKRIYSAGDEYKNEGSCFLEDLFKNNKLEYVYILNDKCTGNIIRSMTLSVNIVNLRYLCIYYDKIKCEIKLDITNEFPKYLTIFKI